MAVVECVPQGLKFTKIGCVAIGIIIVNGDEIVCDEYAIAKAGYETKYHKIVKYYP